MSRISYETWIEANKIENAALYFGMLSINPGLKGSEEYHEQETKNALAKLDRYPVVTMDGPNKKGRMVITFGWSDGETRIALPPAEAEAAYKWLEDGRKRYYNYFH